MAGSSQLTVNQEISESIILDLLHRLTTAESKIVGGYDDNANTLEQLNKLIVGLNEIRDFFKNSGHDTAEGIHVKNILESILNKLSINLKTHDDGQEVALRAVHQLKAEFNELNWIFSKLQLQEISLSIIQRRFGRLTKVKSDKMLDHLKNLSADLNNLSNLLMNSGHDTAGGALVKALLESILHKSDVRELASFIEGELALKAELHKLKGIVSNLIDQFMKLQLPVDPGGSEFKDSLTITKINKTIIPAVLTRLELANTYSFLQNPSDKYQSTGKQIKKLTADLRYITSVLTKLDDNSNNLRPRLRNFVEAIIRYSGLGNLGTGCEDEAKQLQAKLRILRKVVVKLKRQISPVTELQPRDSDDHWYEQVEREFVLDMFPVLHLDDKFSNSSAFGEFREVYESLELTTKMCLLCFAVIPENEVVKKRFMTHWWVGEDFVSPPPWKTYEEAADEIFQELVKKNYIEPVNEKHRPTANRYKMDPFIRTAVIMLAKEAGFFDFDDTGNPSANFKRSYRACLVEGCFQKLLNELDPEKLQVLFNVNVPYPDYVFKFKGFSKLKNVKVLYLGRWQSSATHYIEVESTKFLAGLKSMKLLRFLSLQGIYRIRELPRSVCELPHLRILDLRGCHNLEALPRWIGSIRRLTHLDISECYLLHYIPKGIATLSQLQVLKGFLISKNSGQNSCTLNHLLKLENLRKLSVYVKMEDFPEAEDVKTLQMFRSLQKLTITWAAGSTTMYVQPTTETCTTPKKSGRGNKNQDKVVAQPMAGSTMNPENAGDNRKDDGGAAQPMAATTKNPQEIEDDKMQDKGVPQPTTETTTTQKNSGAKKNEDKGVAQPMAGSTMNPENVGDNRKQDRVAITEMAATVGKPVISRTMVKREAPNKSSWLQRQRGTVFARPKIVLRTLEKLDLKCYPHATAPSWLRPGILPELQKLYIRGGNLRNLSPDQQNEKWPRVEVLRLKFLSDLKMDWKKLRSSFPRLTYLENFKCPNLTYFPCNENGVVWLQEQ